MPFTDPFIGLVPRKMSDSELARAIRINIAAEIDAINLYAAHMDATDNQAARRMLAHIIDEEKEHLAEFLELLKILDPKQAADLDEAPAKVSVVLAGGDPDHEEAPAEKPAGGAASETTPRAQTTVGSLRPTPKP